MEATWVTFKRRGATLGEGGEPPDVSDPSWSMEASWTSEVVEVSMAMVSTVSASYEN
jgi:hypothetical protein